MFKRLLLISLCAGSLSVLGCAVASTMTPVSNGALFTNVQGPLVATDYAGNAKVGTASCSNILGLVAMGDASIESAKKSANITRIASVDYESFSVLGLFATFTVVVRGD